MPATTPQLPAEVWAPSLCHVDQHESIVRDTYSNGGQFQGDKKHLAQRIAQFYTLRHMNVVCLHNLIARQTHSCVASCGIASQVCQAFN